MLLNHEPLVWSSPTHRFVPSSGRISWVVSSFWSIVVIGLPSVIYHVTSNLLEFRWASEISAGIPNRFKPLIGKISVIQFIFLFFAWVSSLAFHMGCDHFFTRRAMLGWFKEAPLTIVVDVKKNHNCKLTAFIVPMISLLQSTLVAQNSRSYQAVAKSFQRAANRSLMVDVVVESFIAFRIMHFGNWRSVRFQPNKRCTMDFKHSWK